jgi:signal transduction histidine kinase
VFYKYLQGFYSALLLLVVSGLLAIRKIMFLNTLIIFLTVTRVYVYSIEHSPEHFHLFRTAYIQYSVVLAGISAITYFTIRFAENAIRAAQEDARIKEQQNQDLLASEEEIRANNEELKATTDALQESYEALEHAKHRAEESNKLKSLFLSNISHEVRTPMNGIIGFSKLLDAEGVDQESKKKFTDIIIKSSEQLLKIIEDIIEVSVLETKKAKLEFSQVNLNYLFQNLIDVFNLKKVNDKVELKLEKGLSDEDAVILTDETRLLKILNNLVENAIKFTEKGFVRVAYIIRNKKIEFEVQDTGIGMDNEKTFDIFDRFGTGR